MRKPLPLLIGCVAMVTLCACSGQSTSTGSDPTETSIAPLTRIPQSTAPTTSGISGFTDSEVNERATSSGVEPTGKVVDAAKATDQPAKEVSTVPSLTPDRTPADRTFFKALSQAGLDVADISEQMIGAAVDVCRSKQSGNESSLLPAVAGQIVAQHRTDMTPSDTANAIKKAAEDAYCK